MHLIIAAFLTLLFVLLAVLVLAACLLTYIAARSPDTNGDPERDAGLPWPPDDDLQPVSQAWDLGSANTAHRNQNKTK